MEKSTRKAEESNRNARKKMTSIIDGGKMRGEVMWRRSHGSVRQGAQDGDVGPSILSGFKDIKYICRGWPLCYFIPQMGTFSSPSCVFLSTL